ncbi:MAG: tRNA (adenosine(37)-N6)-dimethylallyltransferase MiaA [Firmicutes bacterium]|nr:tRNA (adenosine(37)-N6)-dimethylallyltransferase MiaA [Bacillota bacterium]
MQKVIVIAGPTAVGKTAVALTLARHLQCEIISTDSVQVYRGLDIGAAKPTMAERAHVPHHLLDIRDPRDNYTVADFQKDAAAAIADIHSRGKIPMLVGGTGLYLRAVIRGFAFSDSGIDPQIRNRLQKLAQTQGAEALHQKLSQVDPQTANKLHPNDLRRVIRALEVIEQNQQPISEQLQQTPAQPVYDAYQFALTLQRATLYQRIEARVDKMMAAGLLREVQQLLLRGVPPEAKAMQSLGYKQLVAHLQGELPLADAVALIKRDTRRFAKRQLTWFRHEQNLTWLEMDQVSPTEAAEIISSYLAGFFQLGEN